MNGRLSLLVIAPLAGLVGLTLPGCQSPGPLFSRQVTLGSLKTSVSQLEFRNEQLSKQVATLKSENRRIEDRLVQEEADNGDLAARLDDARNLLGERGVNIRTGARTDDLSEQSPSSSKVRRSKSTRKPPAASIPGRIEPARDFEGDDVGLADPPARSRTVARQPRDQRWLPVARGLAVGQSAVK